MQNNLSILRMLYDVSSSMDPLQIYALPQHINSHGELVVFTKDFAQLMGITPEEVEVARVRVIFGNFVDKEDRRLHIPKTLPLKDALLIAEDIG